MNERKAPPDTGEAGDLDDLGVRLKAARTVEAARTGSRTAADEAERLDRASGLSAGFQVATELVSAMLVAVAIGWFLDDWLETRPLFLIVFFFLGATAGALNVYRRAKKMVAADGTDTQISAAAPKDKE